MSYQKGQVYIDGDFFDSPDLAIMLPHSCDEWIIGGAKEVDALIADLEKAKPELAQRLSEAQATTEPDENATQNPTIIGDTKQGIIGGEDE
jgi:hypothetical protein